MNKLADFLDISHDFMASIDVDHIYNPYAAPRNYIAQWVMGNQVIRMFAKKSVCSSLKKAARNMLVVPRTSKPPMDREAIEFLTTIYRTEVSALESLLGKNLNVLRRAWT